MSIQEIFQQYAEINLILQKNILRTLKFQGIITAK